MSEVCFDCYLKIAKPSQREIKRIVLSSHETAICEFCGQIKPFIVLIRPTLKERIERLLCRSIG